MDSFSSAVVLQPFADARFCRLFVLDACLQRPFVGLAAAAAVVVVVAVVAVVVVVVVVVVVNIGRAPELTPFLAIFIA